MEYKVVNALSRDVEREHLNKILKHISGTLSSVSTGGLTEAQVRAWIAESMPVIPSARPITVTLTGDATGSGSGTTSISIPVKLTGNYIEDAPADSLPYWRQDGQWSNVPFPLISLAYADSSGMYYYDADDFTWRLATTDDLTEGDTNLYWKEAPIDGKYYSRRNASWQESTAEQVYQRILDTGDFRITSDGHLRISN